MQVWQESVLTFYCPLIQVKHGLRTPVCGGIVFRDKQKNCNQLWQLFLAPNLAPPYPMIEGYGLCGLLAPCEAQYGEAETQQR